MPHFSKPYFRKNRQTWTVQIDGHQHNLGRDRDAAFQKYHELMATPPAVQEPTKPATTSVLVIIDKYLDWCKDRLRRQLCFLSVADSDGAETDEGARQPSRSRAETREVRCDGSLAEREAEVEGKTASPSESPAEKNSRSGKAAR